MDISGLKDFYRGNISSAVLHQYLGRFNKHVWINVSEKTVTKNLLIMAVSNYESHCVNISYNIIIKI